jgi:pyruvate dehydrogenase complex dehydrogenase (E1) component
MGKSYEFCLVCFGEYSDVNEARRAIHDPYIEDYVEETGKFNFHDLENIRVTNRISLSDLEIEELEYGVFQITCPEAQVVLNQPKAEKIAESFRMQAIFDEIRIEPLISDES